MILRLREAAQPDRPAPPAFEAYVEKVRLHAYEITDAEVEELKDAGTEDEIFEYTVSAAVGAGLERLDAALAVLE